MIPRLSPIEFQILRVLADAGKPLYALEVARKGRSTVRGADGKVRFVELVKEGTVYVTLARMMEKKLIEKRSLLESRPLYLATPQGEKLFKIAQQFEKGK